MVASRIEAKNLSMIGLVCRDNFGWIQHTDSKEIGDCHIHVAEVMAIRKVVLTTLRNSYQCYRGEWFSISDSGN